MVKKVKSCESNGDGYSCYVHVDVALREIYMFGRIGELSSMSFVMALRSLNSDSSKDIKLILNCDGGDEYCGWAIYDSIKNSKALVMADVYGQCMSMAVCVLQACAYRAVAKNAKLMIHDGYSELGKIVSSRVQVQAKEALELNEKYYRALEERSNLSLEQVQSLCEDETYMSAEVAVGYGFADTIIGSEPARRSRRSK